MKLKRSDCSVLTLVLKGKWYDMIANGEKREEYRACTDYWRARLSNFIERGADRRLVVAFSRGYKKPDLFFKLASIQLFCSQKHKEWGELRRP